MADTNITLLIIQVIIVSILFLIIIRMFKFLRILKLENRISRFTLEPLKNDDLSFFDEVELLFYKSRRNFANHLSKSQLLVNYSKKYEKYVDKTKMIPEEGMDYVATKIYFGFIVLLVVVISDVIWYNPISFFQISYSLLIGFFIPDILLISSKKIRKKQTEDDLLKAITIMNNAFKSGNSIMQAIYLASTEIDGPIKGEFKKMYIDLSYGLSLETVFKRFSKRVDLEEVKYMTTSLTILNKTGGNIAKVFGSIEKSFFARRKLKHEMKSLTSTADFMFKILIAIPLIIFALVFSINADYFVPLYTTSIGLIILTLIVTIYISYIFIVRRIMKVEGV